MEIGSVKVISNSIFQSTIGLSIILVLSSPAFAGSGKGNCTGMKQNSGMTKGMTIDNRIQHQRYRIQQAVKMGTIDQQRAAKLNKGLDDLSARLQSARQQNGGVLNPEQHIQFETSLNQNNQVIRSFEGAGTSKVQAGDVVGPKWSPGPDGAQDPNSLLKKMKQQEKMQLRQERQALEQKTEQQQLDYERSMLPRMQDQRKDILKQEGQVKQIRSQTGAN